MCILSIFRSTSFKWFGGLTNCSQRFSVFGLNRNWGFQTRWKNRACKNTSRGRVLDV
ncbi:hypothetical protein HanIR_Chr09g0449411 [Helianthus annuus]|nr:hypothetical protein HanIR_Chr09g0449411 [Helianthus annuus]